MNPDAPTPYTRCEAVAEPTNEWRFTSRCERIECHDGPHVTLLGETLRRVWYDPRTIDSIMRETKYGQY